MLTRAERETARNGRLTGGFSLGREASKVLVPACALKFYSSMTFPPCSVLGNLCMKELSELKPGRRGKCYQVLATGSPHVNEEVSG